jgi:hypothetical protein
MPLFTIHRTVTTDLSLPNVVHVSDQLHGAGCSIPGEHMVFPSRDAFYLWRDHRYRDYGEVVPHPQPTEQRCGCDIPPGLCRRRPGQLMPVWAPETDRQCLPG